MKAEYSVRRAGPADLPRILAIERAGFGEWAWDRKLFAEYTRICGELFLVTLVGGKVVGYCIGRVARGGASVESIAVAPSVRGKGAADALLRSLLRRLRARGVARVSLMVKEDNLRARAFYERYGFRRVRRVAEYYEDGSAGLLMHLCR
jgi:[ribosomal protein S18]-alanine N-acetyltransferase